MTINDKNQVLLKKFATSAVLFYILAFPIAYAVDLLMGAEDTWSWMDEAGKNVILALLFAGIMTFSSGSKKNG